MKRTPLNRKTGLSRNTSRPLSRSKGLVRGNGQGAGLSREKAAQRLPRPCEVCGAIFEPKWVGRAWSRSCGEACARELRVRPLRKPRVELTCEVCGMRWDVQPSQAEGRRTCSLGCAATLKRREQSGKRKGETNPNHRHGKRAGSRDRAGERRWYAALGRLCAGPCDSHLGRLALHHVVYRQTVIREGGDPWDPRNAFTICASGHARHHHRTRPIPLAALPDSAYEFAADLLGAEAAFNYLTRRYAGTDPRLDELLAGV